MTAELGVFLLIIALLTALLQASYLLPLSTRPAIEACRPAASLLQALCITLAFATLITLRLDSDFTVVNVAAHSNLSLPLLYKIAGTWGNHEGSMLLWVWVLVMFGAILSLTQRNEMAALAVSVQSALAAGFLLFILATSNPFARQFPPPPDGEALNPLLQDMALAIHPPMLYLGYVGFSIVFSLSVAALLQGRAGRDTAQLLHPWILASWSALTVGIGLGSWWAYRVLGWGGWWFWDPVENASLLPWLAGTALLHSNIVLKKRGALTSWVLLLSIITFGLSLLGTFLVRSGVLTSVHSFASDPARGFFILIYMALILGSALFLFALRIGRIEHHESLLPLSREGMIVINNLFLLTACATVLLGTIYPMLVEAIGGEKLTVGTPYFYFTFVPLMALPLLLAGLAPFIPWKTASLKQAFNQAKPAALAALAIVILILAFLAREKLLAAFGFGLSAWLALASAQWLWQRHYTQGSWAVFLGHFGAALVIAGVTGSSLWKEEGEHWLKPHDHVAFAGYDIVFSQVEPLDGANYHGLCAIFDIGHAGHPITALTPEYRLYDIRKTATSEAAIYTSWFSDLYAVVGERSEDGSHIAARFYYQPLVRLIWLGCLVMAAGGIAAFVQRRKL